MAWRTEEGRVEVEETNGRGQDGLLDSEDAMVGRSEESGAATGDGGDEGREFGWIEEDLLRIAAADKKTISIKWDSQHERMARDLETDLHFDRGLSTRTVNRSTLSALGLEFLYEKFYGRKPPGL